MTWYAIRTKPGGLRFNSPRPFDAEGTTVDDYKTQLWNQANANRAAVEIELLHHGIEYFLPIETDQITHWRTKKRITIRKPLCPGYVFVQDITDWSLFERLRWAGGPVRVGQEPAIVPEKDIRALREAESMIAEATEARLMSESMRSKHLAKRFPSGTHITISGGILDGREAWVAETTGRNTIRAFVKGFFGAEVSVEIPVASAEIVM